MKRSSILLLHRSSEHYFCQEASLQLVNRQNPNKHISLVWLWTAIKRFHHICWKWRDWRTLPAVEVGAITLDVENTWSSFSQIHAPDWFKGWPFPPPHFFHFNPLASWHWPNACLNGMNVITTMFAALELPEVVVGTSLSKQVFRNMNLYIHVLCHAGGENWQSHLW